MSQNAAELTVQDLRNMRRSFSRQELLDLIDRMFTDENAALDMDVVDAAIFRLLLAEGQEPTPDNLQKRFSEVGRAEGVHSGSVRGSVLRGLESMKEYLKENW